MTESNAFTTAADYLAQRVAALEEELRAQKELNRKNIDRWERERSDQQLERMRVHLLTKVEAAEYLGNGMLPDNFAMRLQNYIEFYRCENCDGRLCMGCVFREWEHECAEDCPECCQDGREIKQVMA